MRLSSSGCSGRRAAHCLRSSGSRPRPRPVRAWGRLCCWMRAWRGSLGRGGVLRIWGGWGGGLRGGGGFLFGWWGGGGGGVGGRGGVFGVWGVWGGVVGGGGLVPDVVVAGVG